MSGVLETSAFGLGRGFGAESPRSRQTVSYAQQQLNARRNSQARHNPSIRAVTPSPAPVLGGVLDAPQSRSVSRPQTYCIFCKRAGHTFEDCRNRLKASNSQK
jgi:hypothetical protein